MLCMFHYSPPQTDIYRKCQDFKSFHTFESVNRIHHFNLTGATEKNETGINILAKKIFNLKIEECHV